MAIFSYQNFNHNPGIIRNADTSQCHYVLHIMLIFFNKQKIGVKNCTLLYHFPSCGVKIFKTSTPSAG